MAVRVVIGAQWGDEGKGKVVDIFAGTSDVIVRFQGGNNAGHTLVKDGETTILHHIPSGILRKEAVNVIAGGVVVDPSVCIDEIRALEKRGLLTNPSQLVIGEECSVIMPYHRVLDAAREREDANGMRIGTTGRGIGPCYEDRVARRSIFVRDLMDRGTLRAKLEANLFEKNAILSLHGAPSFDVEELLEQYLAFGEQLLPFVGQAGRRVRDAIDDDREVLFEGAQGTLLDIGLGTYPFVTSSHTIAGSACVGVGVSPRAIDTIIGVTKAYCTRVGEGPFPTELNDDVGDFLREEGAEFGSTTGRPRRCGWLDAAALKYAARVNGFTSLAMTKLDVLTGLDELKICTGYRAEDGTEWDEPPMDWHILERIEPVYESCPGWSEDVTAARKMEDLPSTTVDYIHRVEELVGVRVGLVSVGPGRGETFER